MPTPPTPDQTPASTGIDGLDNILRGGLARRRLFLLEGVPGSGKTTLALQFLRAAVVRGEPVLYVTLSETEEELRAVARSHGWTLDGITIQELIPTEAALDPDEQYTMFHASEVELSTTVKEVLTTVDRVNPACVVFDSLSELRLLAGNALRYRRHILALKQFFNSRQCTVLLLDFMTATEQDQQMQSIAHGVIRLEQLSHEYGSERRRLRVLKYRGVAFRGGYHDYVIRRGGLDVFPRLIASEHRRSGRRLQHASGIPGLDAMLGGGIEEGTSTLIVGPAGTGKSTLAAQFAVAAAARGQRAALFVFDEIPDTLISRCMGLKIDLASFIESGAITLQQVDPAELAPGEFTSAIRRAVVEHGASIVVIDSLNGYLNSMPEERFVTIHLHELLMYLGLVGVATILIGAHQGMIGTQMQTPVDASYFADAVILLRYFEARGEIRQAIAIMKKRGGQHERTIREFLIEDRGISVGEPLTDFRGILTGVPVYDAAAADSKQGTLT
ncbi:MAG TPA: ATPase domain-containing protein [Vicinamibacterales bacterium]|nr:ATPase domain-containing protein [Vicinamibacterales bacterium]